MLDTLRTASTGWLAKILIGLLVISFAVWGISGSLFYGNQTTVAQVGKTTVSTLDFRLAYENQLGALSQQFGRRLSRQQADAFGLRQNVIDQVVAGALLDENARKMGLGIGETELAQVIASDPAFQDLSGNFSRNALAATLRQYGISQEDYINSRQRVALRNQIQAGTAAALDLPEAFESAYTQYLNERRTVQYVEFGSEVIETQPSPSDSDLQTYYDDNKSDFVAPEYRKIDYILLQASDLANVDEITDEEVRAEYENRKDNLRSPERRTVEQLVLSSAEEASEVSQRLKDGESFETVVSDLGRSISDLSLGAVTESDLPDEAVSIAVFNAELNQPTDVVEGIFGPVIVRVTNIEPERTTPFAEIETQLRTDLATRAAGDRVFELYDAIEEERGAGEFIGPIAERMQLESQTIEAIDAQGLDIAGNAVENIPNIRALTAQAFQSEPGDDTRPIEVGANGFIWFDVAEIIPERQKTFEEVKVDLEAAWIAAETEKKINAIADTIVTRVNANEALDDVIAELLPADSFGQPVKSSEATELTRAEDHETLSRTAVQSAFGVSNGVATRALSGENKVTVMVVTDVALPTEARIEIEIISGINEVASQDVLTQVVQDLQSRESVTINPSAIEAAFNPHGG